MMKALDKRGYILGLIVISIIMLAGAIYAVQIPRKQEIEGKWVSHTREVLAALDTLSKHMTEAETGERGYVLTGDASFLAPYLDAITFIDADVARIETLITDNPVQQARAPSLREDVKNKLDHLREVVDLREHDGFDAAAKSIATGRGRDLMSSIHRKIEEMRHEEEALLNIRVEKWSSAAALTRMVVLSIGGMVYLLACIIYFNLYQEAKRRQQLAEAEARANAIQRAEAERLANIVTIQREIAAHNMDLAAAMNIISRETQKLTHASGAIVEMLDGGDIVYRAGSGAAAAHVGVRIKAQGSLSGLCMRENHVLRCVDSETDDRVDREACRRVGLRSMVVVPLRHHGKSVGVLKVLSPHTNAFADEAVATLELMAGVLSASISDAITADAIRGANQQLTIANESLVLQKMELESANKLLEGLATTDGLTGLKNHRTFQEQLALEFQRATRHKKPFSLIILDVDYFKKYNDTFGHPAGDAVLKKIGAMLATAARSTDCVARYGGEEFALLLPETDADGAMVIAERVRAAIASAEWEQREITVSVGVSSFSGQKEASELLNAADKALYVSKTNGRNRVSAAARDGIAA